MGGTKDLKKHTTPLGASGTDVVGRIHNAEDNIELLQGYRAAFIYDKMRRSDTQVRKILTAIINPIKSATWVIEPASEETDDLEKAALMEQILFKDINWTKFLNECLTMVPHGFSLFEVVHKNREHKDFGPYTGLAQLGFRRQSTITEWIHNRTTGELLEIKQESESDIQVNTHIPVDVLLCFFSEQEGDNIGFPLLRNVYGPYKRKLLATELQYIGIERFAIPTPTLQIPKNIKSTDAEYEAAVDALKGFTSAEDSFITYPEGYVLDLHNNVFDPEKLNKVIKKEDENMASAILGSFLELGTGGNSGAFSLAADLSDFFFAGLTYYANIVRDTINHILIPQLMRLNYDESQIDQLPELAYSGITDNAGKDLMEVIAGLTNAGLVSLDEQLEDHVRKVFKLPKKAEGEVIENQTTKEGNNDNGDAGGGPLNNQPDNDNNDLDDDSNSERRLALSDLGHRHNGTGPSIPRGEKHYHEILDADGNVIGKTSNEKGGSSHTHDKPDSSKTGKPVKITEVSEPKDNPRMIMEAAELATAQIIRSNLKKISDKYINDVIKKYEKLPANSKQKAIQDIKIGFKAQFKKEIKLALTDAARQSMDLVKQDVPGLENVKLSEDKGALLKEFKMESFKFNDFSSLPRRIQILIANQAGIISDKEAGDVADTTALIFTNAEASTKDADRIKADMQQAADDHINSSSRDLAAANMVSTVVNQTRNTFLATPEAEELVASFTFYNPDPKSEICKTLAGTTYNVGDQNLATYQPPLHHNCKSYLRANLKTSKNKPAVTGLPPISEKAEKSITFKETE